jgi:hypothetical protein
VQGAWLSSAIKLRISDAFASLLVRIGLCDSEHVQQGMKDPLGYSIAEFSRLFQHSPSWGYRQVYAGRVAVIDGLGDLRVPASEVQRLLNSARRFDPQPTNNRETAPIF